MKKYILFTLFFVSLGAWAQQNAYRGAGKMGSTKIVTSSSLSSDFTSQTASGSKTMNGNGLIGAKIEASRFLGQATLGPSNPSIEKLAKSLDFEGWINAEFTKPHISYAADMDMIFDQMNQWRIEAGEEPMELLPEMTFSAACWEKLIKQNDELRQRVTMALGEILVVSLKSPLGGRPRSVGNFYDILAEHAFGNYEDMLQDVTRSGAMGVYLSHFNNPKSDEEANIHPDENYARELLQLFSIGLNQLNLDGSVVLDEEGFAIPTYNNNDITGLAKVMTGLSAGARLDGNTPYFGQGYWIMDYGVPLAMYDEYHEPGPKEFLGLTLDGSMAPLQEIEAAVSHIFNHPNVGPFLARRLIQQMVKSNPTPGYVSRVASAFNNNGNGERGDMRAVIKAILLDDEARTCAAINDPQNGKLREPMLRYMHFVRAIEKDSPYGVYYNHMWNFEDRIGQSIARSPSVFNFYQPFYQPIGPLADQNLVAPEFQLHNTQSAIAFPNIVTNWLGGQHIWWNAHVPEGVSINWTRWESLAYDTEALINEVDILFMGGGMSQDTQQILRDAINEVDGDEHGDDWLTQRAKVAIYLTFFSPDYAIQR